MAAFLRAAEVELTRITRATSVAKKRRDPYRRSLSQSAPLSCGIVAKIPERMTCGPCSTFCAVFPAERIDGTAAFGCTTGCPGGGARLPALSPPAASLLRIVPFISLVGSFRRARPLPNNDTGDGRTVRTSVVL